MTTYPPDPAPTIQDHIAYLRQRVAHAAEKGCGFCAQDLESIMALLAEVERPKEDKALMETNFRPLEDGWALCPACRYWVFGPGRHTCTGSGRLPVAEVERRREGER